MTAWKIKCAESSCQAETVPSNITDLIRQIIAMRAAGSFAANVERCGYIEKRFELQESGETWEPYLRGVVPLGEADDTYQPFVFLVRYSPVGPADSVWFYYKDLRASGGRLKLGYGPGGPPDSYKDSLLRLFRELKRIGCRHRRHTPVYKTRIGHESWWAGRFRNRRLLIVSEHSMSSEWAKTDIAKARLREDREKKNLLFPITLGSDGGSEEVEAV